MAMLKENLVPYFNDIPDGGGISQFFVQYCLYPRLMFSPSDALYSIKFLKILVELRVPKINVLNIFAQIMKGIIPTIHCCTNNESENLGIFFMEWFQMIDRWTKQDIWKKECADYSGFSQKVG
jgi:THO complex subunit 2